LGGAVIFDVFAVDALAGLDGEDCGGDDEDKIEEVHIG